MTCASKQDQHFIQHPKWSFLTLRSTYGSSMPYKTHQHHTVSLGVILEGITCSQIDGVDYELSVGDMVLIPAYRAHSCNPMAGTKRSYHMLYMDAMWCTNVFDGMSSNMCFDTSDPVIRDAASYPAIKAWLDQFSAMNTNGLAMLQQLLKEHGTLKPKDRPDECYAAPEQVFMESEKNIAQLAHENGLSREGYIRAIKRKTGLSPLALRHNERIEQAKVLIAQGKPLVEVALAVGYQDQSQFHKHFVHYSAATPKQYQNAILALSSH